METKTPNNKTTKSSQNLSKISQFYLQENMLPFQTCGEYIEVNIKMQVEFDTPGYILLVQSFTAKESQNSVQSNFSPYKKRPVSWSIKIKTTQFYYQLQFHFSVLYKKGTCKNACANRPGTFPFYIKKQEKEETRHENSDQSGKVRQGWCQKLLPFLLHSTESHKWLVTKASRQRFVFN